MCVCQIASVVSDSLQPVDCSPPASSVHGILQAKILEWVSMSSSSWHLLDVISYLSVDKVGEIENGDFPSGFPCLNEC